MHAASPAPLLALMVRELLPSEAWPASAVGATGAQGAGACFKCGGVEVGGPLPGFVPSPSLLEGRSLPGGKAAGGASDAAGVAASCVMGSQSMAASGG